MDSLVISLVCPYVLGNRRRLSPGGAGASLSGRSYQTGRAQCPAGYL